MAKLILITGGARSGKSHFAEKLLLEAPAVTYIATAEALDGEMTARIAAHQARRPIHWQTIESPRCLDAAVHEASTAWVLIDCLAIWVANLLQNGWDQAREDWQPGVDPEQLVQTAVERLLPAIAERSGTVVAVTNEVGSGVVPPYHLGRVYRDLLGLTNQRLAAAADQVYCCISGLPLLLKGDS